MDLRTTLKDLNKQKKWDEILEHLPAWQKANEKKNPWAAFYFASALRKSNRSKEALDILRTAARELPPADKDNDWDNRCRQKLFGLAAWCIWDISVKNTTEAGELLEAALRIRATLRACGGELHESKAPYITAATKASKALLQGQGRGMHQVVDLLECLNPELLETDRFQTDSGDELASQRERWYEQMAKALHASQQWDRLIQICDQGLAHSLHHKTQYFIIYRKAQALRQTGKSEEACALLSSLVAKRFEWWVLMELAQTKWDLGNHRAAIRDACIAFVETKIDSLVAKSLLTISEWILQQGRPKLGDVVAPFVELVWVENGWPIKDALRSRLGALHVSNESDVKDPNILARNIIQELWKVLDEFDPPLTGIVKRFLPNGKAMFLGVEGRGDVYARVHGRKQPKIGDRVSFRLFSSYDRKRDEITDAAIHINVLH